MNPIDLRKKSIDDLSNELVELRKAQFTARIQITTQQSNKNDQLSKLQKDNINHYKDFYIFTGSSVGVVPILGKGIYKGVIDNLGSVSANIN